MPLQWEDCIAAKVDTEGKTPDQVSAARISEMNKKMEKGEFNPSMLTPASTS